MTVINNYLTSVVEEKKSYQKITQKSQTPVQNNLTPAPVTETVVQNKIVPEDPAKYGIVSVEEADMPRNEQQWESFVRNNLKESISTPEAQKVMQKNTISREEYTKRMKTMNEQIAKLETEQKINPLDDSIKEQLKNLYMVKATATVLESKMVMEKPVVQSN